MMKSSWRWTRKFWAALILGLLLEMVLAAIFIMGNKYVGQPYIFKIFTTACVPLHHVHPKFIYHFALSGPSKTNLGTSKTYPDTAYTPNFHDCISKLWTPPNSRLYSRQGGLLFIRTSTWADSTAKAHTNPYMCHLRLTTVGPSSIDSIPKEQTP
jgi:hypothetical protein